MYTDTAWSGSVIKARIAAGLKIISVIDYWWLITTISQNKVNKDLITRMVME